MKALKVGDIVYSTVNKRLFRIVEKYYGPPRAQRKYRLSSVGAVDKHIKIESGFDMARYYRKATTAEIILFGKKGSISQYK